jgi:hypothetical protein
MKHGEYLCMDSKNNLHNLKKSNELMWVVDENSVDNFLFVGI